MHIDLKDYFPAHLFIEMCYGRKNKFGLIYEQKLPYEEFNKLCESYGVFNGCQELTEEIIENINKAIQRGIKNYMFDVKNSSFIKTIAFEIVDGTVSGRRKGSWRGDLCFRGSGLQRRGHLPVHQIRI